MQMERVRLNHSNGYCHSNYNYKYSQFGNDHNNSDETEEELDPLSRGRNDLQKSRFLMSPTNTYPFSTSPSSPESIEHRVSRMDTLAGVAIKYGVEVADIKKFNGLVTDHQMFALKSLQIPLPGRHPPSSCLSNGHDTSRQQAPGCSLHTDFVDSFQSLRPYSSQRKVSPAMSSLQGYYGLKTITDSKITEAFEIGEYRKGDSDYQEDVQYVKPAPASNTPLSSHWKSRSLVNGFLDENNGMANEQLSIEPRENDSEKWNEKLVRRRQKSEADFTSISHVTLMREDSCGSVSSAITGKSLALRSKASSRAVSPTDAETGVLTDTLITGGFFSIRRSSSTSSLHDQESSSSSMWAASKWRLKPDLQSFSAAAIARPIFDGLPKPITSRRNKTALD